MNHYQEFYALHQRPQGFILGNVWNSASARQAQLAGFQAIGTSSAAMAENLGYSDGERMPFSVLLEQIRSIREAVDLPLSVDIEGGYSRDPGIISEHIYQLSQMGVVGINIEDSVVSDCRSLLPAAEFANLLKKIDHQLKEKNIQMFINVRTDAFLLHPDEALEISLERIRLYQDSGADGVFIPGLSAEDAVQCVLQELQVPLNLMSLPNLTDIKSLCELGVKRFSMGDFAYAASQVYFRNLLIDVCKNESFHGLFAHEQ
ncbi:isocitrate lyase/phosphoenolpyruvate mutase family protein [Marinicella sp. W31]|uniref:isocitrate lyase/PEP mutase family protein n=1 Tax=Marinicella sp. W31 TaxID=3023713 RepID=UPI003757D8E5